MLSSVSCARNLRALPSKDSSIYVFCDIPPLIQFFGVVDTSKLVLADNPSGRGTGQRWWSKECREAVAEHQAARKEWKHHRNDDALEPELREARNDSKKKLSKTVKKAKDDFYRSIVNDLLTEPKQLFQAVKWLQKRQRYNPPLLRDTSNNLLTDTHDKIQLLMRTHVMRENVHDLEAPQHYLGNCCSEILLFCCWPWRGHLCPQGAVYGVTSDKLIAEMRHKP